MPILVFNFKREGNIERAIAGHADRHPGQRDGLKPYTVLAESDR